MVEIGLELKQLLLDALNIFEFESKISRYELEYPFPSSKKTYVSVTENYAIERLEQEGYSVSEIEQVGTQSYRFNKKNVATFGHLADLGLRYLFNKKFVKSNLWLNFVNKKLKIPHYVNEHFPGDSYLGFFKKFCGKVKGIKKYIEIPKKIHQYSDFGEIEIAEEILKQPDGTKVLFNAENTVVEEIKKMGKVGALHASVPLKPEDHKMGILVSKHRGKDLQTILMDNFSDYDLLWDCFFEFGKNISFFLSNNISFNDSLLSNYVYDNKNVRRIDPFHIIEKDIQGGMGRGYRIVTTQVFAPELEIKEIAFEIKHSVDMAYYQKEFQPRNGYTSMRNWGMGEGALCYISTYLFSAFSYGFYDFVNNSNSKNKDECIKGIEKCFTLAIDGLKQESIYTDAPPFNPEYVKLKNETTRKGIRKRIERGVEMFLGGKNN